MRNEHIKDPKPVISAIKEFDELGREEFLKKYRFGKSRNYYLIYNGKKYDAKAILGVSHKFKFPYEDIPHINGGGEWTVKKILNDMGFTVLKYYSNKLLGNDFLQLSNDIEIVFGYFSEGFIFTSEFFVKNFKFSIDFVLPKFISYKSLVFLFLPDKQNSDCWIESEILYCSKKYQKDITLIEDKHSCLLVFLMVKEVIPYNDYRFLGKFAFLSNDETSLFIKCEGKSAFHNQEFDSDKIEDERKKAFLNLVKRQGQPEFRKRLLDEYECKCAITKCDVIETLEAAHVFPYMGEKSNNLQNGVLLRADLHILFDQHLLSINPETMKVEISNKLKESIYKELTGTDISKPKNKRNQPNFKSLKKHYKEFMKKND